MVVEAKILTQSYIKASSGGGLRVTSMDIATTKAVIVNMERILAPSHSKLMWSFGMNRKFWSS